MNRPRSGSTAKEWTLVRMPERTRKVPTIDIEKAKTESIIVQARKPSRVASTVTEWSKAVAASHGISEAFSTGSQNHQPPHPSAVERDYAQHAVICVATPVEGHAHRAWERFTPQGPLAVLPCGHDCAIVHTADPAEADALMALGDDAYRARLQAHFGERLHFASVGPRARYPLLLRYRPDPVGPRTVWLGNAAQTLHPVAGQGYNLALRDVWALAQVLLRADGDPGAPDTLARYASERRLDRQGTIRFTDGLVRLFSNAIPPLAHARGAGLFALDLLPPARHFVAKRMMFGARAWP